ncbi:hypothetical protein J5Y03_17020 [Bacillus sp. RG28]|uniref:Uncharacterized protein n=1 Tax=Gottfriedia endophytica TaxID=2820819 RepID=A0A940NQA8_9BACI|nr:double-CXXCG motif protein [Gottfriedia endophytica]MBP0726861.1 hypothetical protein [Gottfriedia endophytica]
MKFFEVNLDEGRRKKYAEACRLSNKTIEDINCPICNTNWVNGTFDRPIEIILTNNNLPDYTYIFPVHFVSEKLKEVILNYSLSEIAFEEIYTKTLEELNEDQIKMFKLDGLRVKNFCSIPSRYYAIDLPEGISVHSDMSIVLHKCENCGRLSYTELKEEKSMLLNFILDRSTWNGIDFFTVKGFPQVFICTERFIEVCKNENITGMIFKEIEVR